ncbi:MAG: pyruvate, phosphate dikinase [Spirochaetaceae bacterium]|jgi:pyruvate,orthophosphate dikinase|nr:pyruvate, phosphate dikinase [Spirochaetaceae bacterium]
MENDSESKNVYFFGENKAEGNAQMKDILGGKGANLAEMTNLKIPVPPGFTISTDVCAAYYENNQTYPEGLEKEVQKQLKKLEKLMGKKLGDPDDPLLVSVRSGAPVSMPGMMDTILNLGMNDKALTGLINQTGNPRFAWDAYRRFIQMYGDVVMQVPHEKFEDALNALKNKHKIELDTELTARNLEEIVKNYKDIVRKHTGRDFPQKPSDQLWGAINAVFGSWMNERAIKYREINEIKNIRGTAVNVQAMVFGNFGNDSGTGVCFSRNPSTGEKVFYGEYLMNAQGEDVVAGIRTPEKIANLAQNNPIIYDELVAIKDKLEKHFRDMQDIEFTVYQGKLFILQTRNAKRTGHAAVKCAVDMVTEELIDKETAILRVSPDHIDQLLHARIDPNVLKKAQALTQGLNASPGAGSGRIVFSAAAAEEWHKNGEQVIMVRKETSPEDIGGMVVSQAILTATGGMTSHAAVVARGMGTPCVAGAQGVSVSGKTVRIGDKTFAEGDWITVDGTTGFVYEGSLPLVDPEINEDMQTFLGWCDTVREKSVRGSVKGFLVRTNADLPEDAARAFDFGAQGIGLCRTEHMFFDKEKLIHFRAMIVADSVEERKIALQKILPLQQKDFAGIFTAMKGRPVTIRLLDPPLHEFVPHTDEEIAELAAYINESPEKLTPKLEKLREQNPMLGHRGCRLAVTYPEIYDMQAQAIAQAAVECLKQTIPLDLEIMIPIVCDEKELALLKPRIQAILSTVFDEAKIKVPVKIGTMIEVPRAALLADSIAQHADFFSFGTNDLTQMTFAFSRDDIASFLPAYLEQKLLETDPFKSIDEKGVGFLIRHAVGAGRRVKPDLKIGICGEHGGDPVTIDFCYRAGLSYVSCSPFRVPIARLAGAQAVLKNGSTEESATTPKNGKSSGSATKSIIMSDAPVIIKKRGRPLGSTKKQAVVSLEEPVIAKKRGRPFGSTKKSPATKALEESLAIRKYGKPTGSDKNLAVIITEEPVVMQNNERLAESSVLCEPLVQEKVVKMTKKRVRSINNKEDKGSDQ